MHTHMHTHTHVHMLQGIGGAPSRYAGYWDCAKQICRAEG